METINIIYSIAALAYICLCIHCSQTGKTNGVNGGEIFLLSLFGTPVIGYLHMIVIMYNKAIQRKKIEGEAARTMAEEYSKVDLTQYK